MTERACVVHQQTKGVNWNSQDVTQTQQRRPESPEVEFMFLVFTHMPGES